MAVRLTLTAIVILSAFSSKLGKSYDRERNPYRRSKEDRRKDTQHKNSANNFTTLSLDEPETVEININPVGQGPAYASGATRSRPFYDIESLHDEALISLTFFQDMNAIRD